MVANADKSEQEERRSKFNQRTHPYKWVSKNRAHNKKFFFLFVIIVNTK